MTETDRTQINSTFFNGISAAQFSAGSPHIAHPSLRALWCQLALSVYKAAVRNADVPAVLDLGAGDGFSSLVFLEQGASVTAVDTSVEPLRRLQRLKIGTDSLTIHQQSVEDYIRENSRRFDIVVASSFLHHVPDYLAPSREYGGLNDARLHSLIPRPLRYDAGMAEPGVWLPKLRILWRIFQPDVFWRCKT